MKPTRQRRKIEEERLVLARQTHKLLHTVFDDAARQLGHVGPKSEGGRDDGAAR